MVDVPQTGVPMRSLVSQIAARKQPMNPPLGLIVALPAEAYSLMGWEGWKRVIDPEMGHFRFRNDSGCLCVHSGLGAGNALAAARWLVREGAGALIAAGIAGGLHPGMKRGDLVIPDLILEENGRNGAPLWDAHCRFAERAYEALVDEGESVHRGPIVSATRAVLTVESKRSLYTRTLALAVDMESAPVARIAVEAGLPFFLLRAVCDPADRSVPKAAFDSIDQNGRIKPLVLLAKLLGRSLLLGDLRPLRRDFVTALASLRRGWEILVKNRLPDLPPSPKS
jgi:adenosylhomocysteine nucleosidase